MDKIAKGKVSQGAGLELATLWEAGFALIALVPLSKRPVQRGWTKLPRGTFEEFSQRYENITGNVGVRLGRVSDAGDGTCLVAFDVDVKATGEAGNEAKRLAVAELDRVFAGWAGSLICESGRGGGSFHVYAWIPVAALPASCLVARSKTKVQVGDKMLPAWEVSFMAEGRQVVLPPSVHPDTGRAYAWAEGASTSKIVKLGSDFKLSGSGSEAVATLPPRSEAPAQWVDVDDADPRWGLVPEDVRAGLDWGVGVTDRSAYLMTVARVLYQAGFSEAEILGVLSDRSRALGVVAFEHAKSGARVVACNWLRRFTVRKALAGTDFNGVEEAVAELDRVRTAEEIEANLASASTGLGGVDGGMRHGSQWVDEGGFWRTKSGRLSSYDNTRRALEKIVKDDVGGAEMGEVLWLNELTGTIMADGSCLLPDRGFEAGCVPLSDTLVLSLKDYVTKEYLFEPAVGILHEAVQVLAYEGRRHPVREYLASVEGTWDGVSRVEELFVRYFVSEEGCGFSDHGQDGEEYARAVGRKFLAAMVARARGPGCPVDFMVMFEGVQGLGKSKGLADLVPDRAWFSDAAVDFRDLKGIAEVIQGAWLFEFGELAGLGKADRNALKAFVTRQTDKFRPAYGRTVVTYPRQTVFVASTNDDEYLNDPSGARRYWPLHLIEVDREAIRQDRDQLWAEAVDRFKNEPLWMETPKLRAIQAAVAALRHVIDEEMGPLESLLSIDKPDEVDHRKLFDLGQPLEGLKFDAGTARRAAAVFKRYGYRRVKRKGHWYYTRKTFK